MTESDTQILITGCYRTGTEYITHLLNNSPDLFATMYVTNFMRYSYGEYDPIEEERQYLSCIFDNGRRIRERWGRRLDVHDVIDTIERSNRVSYGIVYDAIMRDLMSESVPNWAEKIQLVWRSIPEFLDTFPNGKAFLVIRDPRSTLASFKNFTYAPEPRYLGAVFNALDAMQKGRTYRSRLSDDSFHIIKYENVVRQPTDTIQEMFNFLELPADHDLLSEDGWTDPSGQPWGVNSAFDGDSSFDKQAAIHRWKGNLEPWELALCERVNAAMMDVYGYDQSDTEVAESEYIDIIKSDAQIRHFYEQWYETGMGVEQFPTDPTDPNNWDDNN